MKKLLTISFFCLITSVSFAQLEKLELKQQLYLNDEQNKDWFIKFKGENRETQLVLLKERITLDTNVVFTKSYPDAHLLKNREYLKEKLPLGKYAGNRILLVINNYIFSEVSYEPKLNLYLQEAKNLIDSINIDKITILQDASAAALYGRMGSGGVIFIKSADKKSEKLVKKLSKKLKKNRNKSET